MKEKGQGQGSRSGYGTDKVRVSGSGGYQGSRVESKSTLLSFTLHTLYIKIGKYKEVCTYVCMRRE
jgi:hypothetical protein